MVACCRLPPPLRIAPLRFYCQPAPAPRPTVRALLLTTTQRLEQEDVPEPELTARYLLSHVLGGSLHSHHERHLDSCLASEQEQELQRLVLCRLARMPLQYLLGSWDFHDISLELRPPVFIPRPETEQLVNEVLRLLPPGPRHLLEVGPGSGALGLALLSARPDLTLTAVERSGAAVELCRRNAELLGLEERVTWLHTRVETLQLAETFDAVVSNPPYVLRKDLAKLAPEIHVYEDLRALDGGAEGLDVILPIMELAENVLKDPDHGFVALEVDPCHPHILPPKLDTFYVAEVIKDFRDKDRFMVMRLKQEGGA